MRYYNDDQIFNAVKNIFINLFLALCAIFLFLITLELVLRIPYFSDAGDRVRIWIPEKYRKINDEINARNKAFSRDNSFGFNDIEREVRKKEGVYRIVILGDSIIWGDGLPYEAIWSHKVEKKMKQVTDEVEVISWGKNGWSTLDEFDFLKKEGPKFNIDLLIVGFVKNDPDMGRYTQKHFSLHKKKELAVVRKILPNAVDFIGAYLDSVINRFSPDFGYDNWLKKLYTEQNLADYQRLLIRFSGFCRENKIKLLFVLTPHNPAPYFKTLYSKIIPLLEKTDIEYLNLYPAVVRDLSKYKHRKLKANPANGHPGDLVTEVYANEVVNYLNKNTLNNL